MRFVNGLGTNLQGGIRELEKDILGVVRDQTEGGRKALVILDGMDFLMAGMGVEIEEVMAMVTEVREVSSHQHQFMGQQSLNGGMN